MMNFLLLTTITNNIDLLCKEIVGIILIFIFYSIDSISGLL